MSVYGCNINTLDVERLLEEKNTHRLAKAAFMAWYGLQRGFVVGGLGVHSEGWGWMRNKFFELQSTLIQCTRRHPADIVLKRYQSECTELLLRIRFLGPVLYPFAYGIRVLKCNTPFEYDDLIAQTNGGESRFPLIIPMVNQPYTPASIARFANIFMCTEKIDVYKLYIHTFYFRVTL